MIALIAAVARNGVIGSGNQMPWHISEDLKRFKSITSGHPVVMGRKTFESLGRALPGRRNVVISRNPHYHAEGAEVVESLEHALGLFGAEEKVFIIGGGEIYRQALPLADRMYLTWVDMDIDGDTRFPDFDETVWKITFRERIRQGEKFPHPFEFVDYTRSKV